MINKIFPDSKTILSIRHPVDCCLSVFFQEFVASPALVKFLSFEKSVDFYQQIFSATEHLLENNSRIIRIRYEGILINLESSISEVLEFLNLTWEPQLQHFHQHAIKHQVNTPSYHQVVEPLYNDSVYRVKNYGDYCDAAKEKLNYWIVKFGYKDI